MELRKDPITRSWVVVGHAESAPASAESCLLCPGHESDTRTILSVPTQGAWQVRVLPHFDPLYRIEGEVGRTAEGIYDTMRPVGAHEIIIETPEHNRPLSHLSDEAIFVVLQTWCARIIDLKRDLRFKYVTLFKDSGPQAGEEWTHSHSQMTATTFVPRRILYELRAAREYITQKDRCVFCDIIRQEERQGQRVVDSHGDYLAFCPFAGRVPFETWIVSRKHNHLFESPRPTAVRSNLAVLLGRVLRRLEKISPSYHLVLHTAPNTQQTKGELSDYWKTIADDYHWHIEILPILEKRSRSYGIKEVYFNAMMPEEAAEKLRQTDHSQ